MQGFQYPGRTMADTCSGCLVDVLQSWHKITLDLWGKWIVQIQHKVWGTAAKKSPAKLPSGGVCVTEDALPQSLEMLLLDFRSRCSGKPTSCELSFKKGTRVSFSAHSISRFFGSWHTATEVWQPCLCLSLVRAMRPVVYFSCSVRVCVRVCRCV